MATTSAPNPRASLLAGLRTGGVRSASGPISNVPYTAAPGATFQVPRYSHHTHDDYIQEEEDELADMVAQNLYVRHSSNRMQQPMTAAVDGSANRFAQQQSIGMNVNPFLGANSQAVQQMQLQMMQIEIARLQAIQAQQYQAEVLAQAQRQRQQQQQQQQPFRRSSVGFVPPASAGPMNSTFDIRSTTTNSQLRRAHQADQLRAKLGVTSEDQVPMTAALGGRFGSRMAPPPFDSDEEEPAHFTRNPPPTPSYTTVISGGTSLGSLSSNNLNSSHHLAPSKSDAAVSWRRGGQSNSVLQNRMASAPLVKITPPPSERVSPPPAVSPLRTRPSPLRFTAAASEPLASVAIVTGDGTDGDDSSSVSSRSNSSPSTPRTASSTEMPPPLSPREEASKKLYEGLGIGRPVPTVTVVAPPTPAYVQRIVSQPVRQPRGPPSNNDELLPKNFATRSRRKAIGALGALLDARERREVEAF